MGNPQTGKLIILQRFSHKSEPHVRLPSQRVWHQEKESLKALGFESQWGLSVGAPQDWGKQTPLMEGAHKASHTLGPSIMQ